MKPAPMKPAPRAPYDFSDLRETAYSKERDCWWFARVVLARMGYTLPATAAEALSGEGVLAAPVTEGPAHTGDVLVIEYPSDDGTGTQTHIGICLDAFQFAHFTSQLGCAIDKIAVYRRCKRIRRHLRPTEAMRSGGGNS